MMAAKGTNIQRPVINMNTYAKYKSEFAVVMKEAQSGELNSQFGKHWYTNLRTGESKSLYNKPDEFWVEGRNWFNHEGKYLYRIKNTKDVYNPIKHIMIKTTQDKLNKQILENNKLWDKFHSGNYKSLLDFANELNISKVALRNRFYRFIPIYKKIVKSKVNFKSNKELIGVYE